MGREFWNGALGTAAPSAALANAADVLYADFLPAGA